MFPYWWTPGAEFQNWCLFFAFLIYEPQPFLPLSGGCFCWSGGESLGWIHILERKKRCGWWLVMGGGRNWRLACERVNDTPPGPSTRPWSQADSWMSQSEAFHSSYSLAAEGPLREDSVNWSGDPGSSTVCFGLQWTAMLIPLLCSAPVSPVSRMLV